MYCGSLLITAAFNIGEKVPPLMLQIWLKVTVIGQAGTLDVAPINCILIITCLDYDDML